MVKKSSFVIFIFLISGCILGIDKPSRYDFETWKKEGSSIVDIKIAMLECGYESPNWNGSMELIQITMAHLCMKNNGFVSLTADYYFSCSNKLLVDHPNCAPDSPVPTRSVQRRLNSSFCKAYPKAYACQPPGTPIPTDAELEEMERKARRPRATRSPDLGTPERNLTEQVQRQNNRGMDQLQRFTK